uniref:NADH dehydrogenase [ubiquinone] 1 alpha subcomplex subunit 3 n=1 Tax=Pygocentrus nattereri TaxID=42514 RepID=A0AAR2M0F3_PYGNA
FSLSVGNFLRNAWNKEPVVAAACGLGFLALIVPLASPFTKYTGMMNKAIPYNYPGKGSNGISLNSTSVQTPTLSFVLCF